MVYVRIIIPIRAVLTIRNC